jgi:uncharacterized membrane protein
VLVAAGVVVTQVLTTSGAAQAAIGIAIPMDMGAPPGTHATRVFDLAENGRSIGWDWEGRGVTWKNGTVTRVPEGADLQAVNDVDQIVGARPGGGQNLLRATLWQPDGTAVDLLPGVNSIAEAINNRGEVLVQSGLQDPPAGRLGVWRPAGGYTELIPPGYSAPLPASVGVYAGDINNRGVVAARVVVKGTTTEEFVMRCDAAGCVRLPNPAGVAIREVRARGINEAGQIAGIVEVPVPGTQAANNPRVVRWDGNQAVLLDGLGGIRTELMFSGRILNERGDIVGRASLPDEKGRAVLWPGGQSAPVVLRQDQSWAISLNDKGDIVGSTATGAFLYRGGRMITLPPQVGFSITAGSASAVAVSNAGTVVGNTYWPSPNPYGGIPDTQRATTWLIL